MRPPSFLRAARTLTVFTCCFAASGEASPAPPASDRHALATASLEILSDTTQSSIHAATRATLVDDEAISDEALLAAARRVGSRSASLAAREVILFRNAEDDIERWTRQLAESETPLPNEALPWLRGRLVETRGRDKNRWTRAVAAVGSEEAAYVLVDSLTGPEFCQPAVEPALAALGSLPVEPMLEAVRAGMEAQLEYESMRQLRIETELQRQHATRLLHRIQRMYPYMDWLTRNGDKRVLPFLLESVDRVARGSSLGRHDVGPALLRIATAHEAVPRLLGALHVAFGRFLESIDAHVGERSTPRPTETVRRIRYVYEILLRYGEHAIPFVTSLSQKHTSDPLRSILVAALVEELHAIEFAPTLVPTSELPGKDGTLRTPAGPNAHWLHGLLRTPGIPPLLASPQIDDAWIAASHELARRSPRLAGDTLHDLVHCMVRRPDDATHDALLALLAGLDDRNDREFVIAAIRLSKADTAELERGLQSPSPAVAMLSASLQLDVDLPRAIDAWIRIVAEHDASIGLHQYRSRMRLFRSEPWAFPSELLARRLAGLDAAPEILDSIASRCREEIAAALSSGSSGERDPYSAIDVTVRRRVIAESAAIRIRDPEIASRSVIRTRHVYTARMREEDLARLGAQHGQAAGPQARALIEELALSGSSVAIHALAGIGDERSIPVLMQCTKSHRSAGLALASFGEAATRAAKLVPPPSAQHTHNHPNVRRYEISRQALSTLEDPDILAELAETIEDREATDETRAAAADLFVRLATSRRDRQTADLLIRGLDRGWPQPRHLLNVLARFDDERLATTAWQSLGHANERVRESAARILSHREPNLGLAVTERLLAFDHPVDDTMLRNVGGILWAIPNMPLRSERVSPEPESLVQTLEPYLEDRRLVWEAAPESSPVTRQPICELAWSAIAALGREEDQVLLARSLVRMPTFPERASSAFQQCGDVTARSWLVEAYRVHGDASLAHLLGELGVTGAIPALGLYVHRSSAVRALGTFGSPARPYLHRALGGHRSPTRLALTALGEIGDRRDFEIVVPFLEDADADLRCTAAEALLAIDASRARDLVEPIALSDPSPLVRSRLLLALARSLATRD